MCLDPSWRFTSHTPDAAAIFGRTSLDGLSMADAMPGWFVSPLGKTLLRVASTRQAATVRVKSMLRPDKDIWARVTPTRDGGVRYAVRFVPTKAKRRSTRRDVAQLASILLPACCSVAALVA